MARGDKPRKPTKRMQYPPELLRKAVDAVMAGAGINQTATYFNIPKSTLSAKQQDIQTKLKEWLESNQTQELTVDIDELKVLIGKDSPKRKKLKPNRKNNPDSRPKTKLKRKQRETNSDIPVMETVFDVVSPELSRESRPTCCCTCLDETSEYLIPIDTQFLNLLTGVLSKDVFDGLKPLDLRICNKCSGQFENTRQFFDSCSSSLVTFMKMAEVEVKSESVVEPSLTEVEVKDEPVGPDAQDENTEFQGLELLEEETMVYCSDEGSGDNSECDEDSRVTTHNDKTYFDSNEGDYCSICNDFYDGSESDHNLSKHCCTSLDGKISCIECEEEFTKQSRFLQHLSDAHIRFKAPVKCPFCNHLAIYKKVLFQHIENHSRDYVCNHCNARFNQKMSLIRHIEANHKEKRQCNTCKEFIAVGEPYDNHIAEHQKQRHICDTCGKSYKSEFTLLYHKRQACNSGAATCQECGQTYPTIRKLMYHVKSAHEEPKHLCTYCGKKFLYATVLRRHIIDSHEKDKLVPETCKVCGKVFKSGRLLMGHTKQVHGKQSWKCTQCEAAFSTKARLQKHTYSHLKKRPFNCHVCGSGYYMTEYLRNHYERAHDMTLNNDEIIKMCIRVKVDQELLKRSD